MAGPAPGATPRPTVGTIVELALRHQQSAALIAACRLDLFSALSDAVLTAEALAARLRTAPRATRQLLDALAALELLTKEADTYRCSALAARFLDRAAPAYLGDLVQWFGDGYLALGALDAVVRRGGPLEGSHAGEELDALPPERLERYARGMLQVGEGTARYLAEHVPFPGEGRLLDVGGGPAVFACALAARHPALSVEVLELPAMSPYALERARAAGLSDRVRVRSGSYLTDDLGADWDAVLLSQVLQTEGPDVGRALLERIATALRPGGQLVIHGVMTDPEGIAPAAQALMSLFFLAEFQGGAAYPWTEVRDWVAAAGLAFDSFERLPAPALTAVLLARKPA